MLLTSTKTWMSLFLALSAVPTVLCAPSQGSLNLEPVQEITSPLALFPRAISHAMTERDVVPTHLDKRAVITSPNTRRVINLSLKEAIHGIAAGTTWTWRIAYQFVGNINGQSGRLTGANEGSSAGSAAFPDFQIEHIFSNAVDGVVTAIFDVVNSANQKFELKLVWDETFKTASATVEQVIHSYCTYFTPGGAQEHLSQDQFSFTLV
ncbi:hypothetical protein COCVIDRAFT_18222 [Bipolaris victoriae FI3]|uniref:Uncharacterized protein n=1 Tax=Bipolaris victoriae (strain FI3) TaxID=930091 RepID=W7E848_BIPV3|nr:hypothetical protein COCVIDRAFT_18222 [Bipolaris victoriae FI3]